MNLQFAIGETIRELRHERNLTLRELSAKSIMSLGYLCEVERGYKSASPETLEFIAKGLEITTTQLIKEIYKYLEEYNG